MFLLRLLVILMTLRYDAFLFLHHRQTFLDDIVQLLRYAVFDVVLIIDDFSRDFLFKVACFVNDGAIFSAGK